MEEIKERLTKLRKAKNLNKTEFAKILELDRSSVSRMENGSASITDRNIMVICKVFRVNEAWLREGIGDMFKTDPYVTPIDKDKKDFFEIFDKLSSGSRNLLLRIAEDILENQEKSKKPNTQSSAEPAEKETHPVHDQNSA
jgi:transcriptional regulator with XRE-family HTH domain